MYSLYYFNIDERNCDVKAPTLSKKELFDMMSDDDKWFDFMHLKYETRTYSFMQKDYFNHCEYYGKYKYTYEDISITYDEITHDETEDEDDDEDDDSIMDVLI
jgi:hypothetical protein